MTYDLVCQKSQFINSSNIHKFLAMIATNKANSLHTFWDGIPEPLKITQRGGRVKGNLSYTSAEIETLLQLMEQCLHVGTQEWEYVETEFSSTHFRPLWDVASLRKKFNMLVKKEIPTGNPTCPPFVWHAKKIFNLLVDKCNLSSHGHIRNLADNNAMLDTVEESNNNQGNEEEQEDDALVIVESPNMISVVDVVDSQPSHDSDAPANLNELPRMVIRSIPSSKKA